MNNLIKLTTALTAIVLITGCAVRTPGGSVVIDPNNRTSVVIGDGGGNGGNFCPPGQAKKGRC